MNIKDTIGSLLTKKSIEHPNKIFLRFRNCHYSYKEVDVITNRIANSLLDLGIKKGDKVAILLENCPEFIFSTFALAKIGAVAVPINTAQKGQLLIYQLDQSDCRMIIIGQSFMKELKVISNELEKLEMIIIVGNDNLMDLNITKLNFSNLLNGKDSGIEKQVEYDELQAIMFTSGTTGSSKGVMITHKHCLTFARDWIIANAYTNEDRLYTPLPLFHAIAHTLGVIAVLLADSEISIVEKFSASKYWDDIRKFDVTVAHAIFAMIPILLNQPPSSKDKEHNLRFIHIGQSALSEKFEYRFGARIVEAYGATENGMVTYMPYGETKPGSCGKPNLNTFDVRIVNEKDEEVGVKEVGEIVIRSKEPNSTMEGYYKMPKETLMAFRNLWFHTGDYAYRDSDGYYYFVDRKKDAIRRRGENISSFEVESIVNSHPAVLESASISVPSELAEDDVKVCVVLKPGKKLIPEDLINYCKENMANYMVPRYVELLEEMPKTSNGKIEKQKLRNAGITLNTWDEEKKTIVGEK